jgi:hypothetical protein
MKKHPEDIIRNLTDFNGYTRKQAEKFIENLQDIIKDLSEIAGSRVLTQDYIKENVFSQPDKTLFLNHILQEIKDDDEMIYAYNYMAQHFNRDEVFYPVKETRNIKVNSKKKGESRFSGLEWGAIIYYADTTKLLNGTTKKDRISYFINKHGVKKTTKYISQKTWVADDRINKKLNFPIDKLQKILPFLKQNYPKTINKVKNDIEFLKNENAEL